MKLELNVETFIHPRNLKVVMKSLLICGKNYSINTKIVGSILVALTIQMSVVAFGLSQSAQAQVDEAFKTYENPKFGLTISYPPDWSVDELRSDPAVPSNNSIVAIFKSPSQGQNDKYLENVMSIEKEVECLKCEKRVADIINKSRRVRKIKNNRQQHN